jgi:hypothetical protein
VLSLDTGFLAVNRARGKGEDSDGGEREQDRVRFFLLVVENW